MRSAQRSKKCASWFQRASRPSLFAPMAMVAPSRALYWQAKCHGRARVRERRTERCGDRCGRREHSHSYRRPAETTSRNTIFRSWKRRLKRCPEDRTPERRPDAVGPPNTIDRKPEQQESLTSILRRLLYRIDNKDVDWSFCRFQPQSKLLLNCREQ